MRLSKFIVIMFVLTVISLIYTHLQVQIFDLAYKGSNKEFRLRKLRDDNDHAKCNISTMKSANYLGIKMLADNKQMKFLDKDHIVTVENEGLFNRSRKIISKKKTRKPNIFARMFSLKSQAEAGSIK